MMTARAANADRSFGAMFNRFLSTLSVAIERRRALRTLMEMDDRMLADIGLTRGTIRERLAATPAATAIVEPAAAPRSVRVSGMPAGARHAANQDAALHDAA